MVLVNPNFTETSLSQPWQAWVKQESATEELVEEAYVETSELCPGGTECGEKPHKLGSTQFCAFAASKMQEPTGTSG